MDEKAQIEQYQEILRQRLQEEACNEDAAEDWTKRFEDERQQIEGLVEELKEKEPEDYAAVCHEKNPYIVALGKLWNRHNDNPHHWKDCFEDERQLRLIQNCRDYADGDPAGLPGHQLMLIISQLADLLDEAW